MPAGDTAAVGTASGGLEIESWLDIRMLKIVWAMQWQRRQQQVGSLCQRSAELKDHIAPFCCLCFCSAPGWHKKVHIKEVHSHDFAPFYAASRSDPGKKKKKAATKGRGPPEAAGQRLSEAKQTLPAARHRQKRPNQPRPLAFPPCSSTVFALMKVEVVFFKTCE